ncbi:MAG: hypothetical protein LC674_05680, partial [Actinobacteria bacterium]|nr:hypothetical protein [Actinomycetota bacterium]
IDLGEQWYRSEPDERNPNSSIFLDVHGGASIASSILPSGKLLQQKEDIPPFLEENSKAQLPIKTSSFKIIKTFRTGNVDWYRARADVSYEAGFSEHLIVQGGFDGTRFFIFYLNCWGDDFENKITEGTAALDSIEIRAN